MTFNTSSFAKAPAVAVQWSAAGLLSLIALPFVILVATVAMFGDGYPDFEEDL